MSSLPELLARMPSPPMLHAAAVHFPVAIAVLGLPLVAAFVVGRGRDRGLRGWTVGLYATLVLTAFLATESGADAAVEIGSANLEARRLVERHAWMARRVWMLGALTALGAAGTALGSRPALARLALLLCGVGALTTAGWVGLVGHHGGMAVYAHGLGAPARAAQEPPATGDPRRAHFGAHVRPLLERHCAGCHGPGEFAASGLDLTSIDGVLRGGRRGPAVVPGSPAASLLVRSVDGTHATLRMPLGRNALTEEEVGHLRTWIEHGAVWPE